MKITTKVYTLIIAFTCSTFLFACDQQARLETNAEATEVETGTEEATNEAAQETREATQEVARETNEATDEGTREVNDFSTWIKEKSTRAENTTEAEWQETKAEYKRREAEMETKSSTWDDKTKQEWQQVKNGWNKTENKVQDRLRQLGNIDVDVDVKEK